MRVAFVIALLAAAIRLAPIADGARPLFSDEQDYDRLARTLASTARYEDDGRPTAYRPVGYPAWVGAIYRVAGPRPEAVRVSQAVLDGATAFLLFVLLRRRGGTAARGAALLWALYPPAILYTRFLRPETLTAFLLVAVAVALSRESAMSRRARVAVGVLIGVTVLVKSEFALVLPAIPFLLERGGDAGAAAARGDGRAARTAALLAGALLVIAPWVARNAAAVGSPTLATSFGAVLLIGNHPAATGGYAPAVPDSMRPRATGELESSRESMRAATSYIAANPGRFLVSVARKWALTLMSEAELVVTALHPRPGDEATSFRAKAREVPVWKHALVSVPYALLLVLGLVGYLAPPGGAAPRFFLAVVAAWLLAHGLTFGGSRYHFPMMPFLVASSAAFLGNPGPRLEAMKSASWVLAGFITAVAVAVWTVEIVVLWFR
ncbi:MAG TPA: hypothetical protein VFU59_12500 [Candidatus Eisenbacteria bacterium]|nr:hypothetical protein [Candidatus Eisenbacteria bacterium]